MESHTRNSGMVTQIDESRGLHHQNDKTTSKTVPEKTTDCHNNQNNNNDNNNNNHLQLPVVNLCEHHSVVHQDVIKCCLRLQTRTLSCPLVVDSRQLTTLLKDQMATNNPNLALRTCSSGAAEKPNARKCFRFSHMLVPNKSSRQNQISGSVSKTSSLPGPSSP